MEKLLTTLKKILFHIKQVAHNLGTPTTLGKRDYTKEYSKKNSQ